jgi:hypothetical protein
MSGSVSSRGTERASDAPEVSRAAASVTLGDGFHFALDEAGTGATPSIDGGALRHADAPNATIAVTSVDRFTAW